MNIIETKDVEFSYGNEEKALRGVSIQITKGKKVIIAGHNGAGKTTLMLHFNGMLKPSAGQVFFNGKPLSYDRQSLRWVRQAVGLVFQNPDDQILAPTVRQDVAFGPLNLGLSEEEVEERVRNALLAVGLEHLADRPPHQLSFGQKKRVAIAGILAMDPEVIILDEPTANLDPRSADELLDLLNELQYEGKTIVVSTHDVEIAYEWGDEVWVMHEGEILGNGLPEDVFGDTRLLKHAGLKPPKVLQIYKELRERCFAKPGRVPRHVLDLVNAIEIPTIRYYKQPWKEMGRIIHKDTGYVVVEVSKDGINPGEIIVCDVDGIEIQEIGKIISEMDVHFIGAMGTKAKALLKEVGITPDFSSNVINNSLLKALTGHNCLIFTSGGMVEHARKRIVDYGVEGNFVVRVNTVPSTERKKEEIAT
jgi:cobalt/nickel transport system ATP-binding protein